MESKLQEFAEYLKLLYSDGKKEYTTSELRYDEIMDLLKLLHSKDLTGKEAWNMLAKYPILHSFLVYEYFDFSNIVMWGLNGKEMDTSEVRVKLLEGLTYQASDFGLIHSNLKFIIGVYFNEYFINTLEKMDIKVCEAYINYIDTISKLIQESKKLVVDHQKRISQKN